MTVPGTLFILCAEGVFPSVINSSKGMFHMWKPITLSSLGFLFALPMTALADPKMDADGDGVVSMSEFNNAMPDAGAEIFSTIDANSDGALSTDELSAARNEGILPPDTSEG